MEKVLDTAGAEIVAGDLVAETNCGHTLRVLSVQPGVLGLVEVRSHGLEHCPFVFAGDLLAGSEVRRVTDAEPVFMHRDGLVAFG